ELEEELGIIIFDRSNKGISLTDEGREFVTYAQRVVGQYEILENRYLSKDHDREIFSVSTQHYNFAIKAFTAVIKKNKPGKYRFSVHETKTKEVLEDVRKLKSEVGIISFSGANENLIKKLFKDYQLEFTPLMKRETYAYVWKNHEFAGRKEISLDELNDYPCVSFNQSSEGNFYLTEEALSDHEYDKMIISDDRATTMEIIAELGGYSIGTGILSWEDAILQGLVSIKLKEEDPLIIGYITAKGSVRSHYGKEYIEELLKYKEI
ncbi:MAG: LysR family transcriptional regulator, partial [Lachnospiraceae bacterium]|nr:LysR family transcriptional regulator [Lachnospiraceae bacterium]